MSRIGILPVVDDLIGTKLEKSILDNSNDSESKRISSAADLFLRIIGVDIEVHASPHYRVFVFFFGKRNTLLKKLDRITFPYILWISYYTEINVILVFFFNQTQ